MLVGTLGRKKPDIGDGALEALKLPAMGKFPENWLHDFYAPYVKGDGWLACSCCDDAKPGDITFVQMRRANPS